jgi:hypothetical protein
MLSDKDAAANIAVKNLETARKFYEHTLVLTQIGTEGKELKVFRSGKLHDKYLSVAVGSNQPGHGNDMDGQLERGRCRTIAQGQGRHVRALLYVGHEARGLCPRRR